MRFGQAFVYKFYPNTGEETYTLFYMKHRSHAISYIHKEGLLDYEK